MKHKMPNDGKQWVEDIKTNLLEEEPQGDNQLWPSIFMASSPLRGLKHSAFVPQVVSIGPYHNELGPHHSAFPPMDKEVERYKGIAAKEMQKHKIMACKLAQKRFKQGKNIIDLTNSFKENLNKTIIPEYDTELDELLEDEEKCALMFALDTGFVVEVLKANYYHPFDVDDEGIYNIDISQTNAETGFSKYYRTRISRSLQKSILQDFVLLENQVPMACLKEMVMMYDFCETEAHAQKTLGEIFMKVVEEIVPFELLEKTTKDSSLFSCLKGEATRDTTRDVFGSDSRRSLSSTGKDVLNDTKHLLDWLYRVVTHTNLREIVQGDTGKSPSNLNYKTRKLVLKPSNFSRAIELHHAGVHFRPTSAPSNVTSVHYDKKTSTLYLPKLHVGDDTERLFRNLIAYESHLVDGVNVLSYLRFMNMLVDTEEDVALLVKNGVISQDIGSDLLVASMMNDLCTNTMTLWSQHFEDIAQQLVVHCTHRFNALKAEMIREYCSKPWLTISVLSAAALLIMTLVITIYTVFIYEKGG